MKNYGQIPCFSGQNISLLLFREYPLHSVYVLSFQRCDLTIVVLIGVFFIKRLSESKYGVGLYINFCFNLILLIIWAVGVLLFKVNSSHRFYIWGFACSLPGTSNTFVDYDFICDREVLPIRTMIYR